jgi:uncharacterized protein YaiL (DUF2058 family)
MAKSLAEQLLGAGLTDKKKVEKARKEKRQQNKVRSGVVDDTQLRLQQERAAQVERDRQLNLKRLEEERAKAIRAQVKQMLQQSRQKSDGEIRFSFTDPRNKKIKQMYVSAAIQDQLACGQLAICADSEEFVLVPRVVADKIAERQTEAVIFLVDQKVDQHAEDDPYKDFPIPDDLMW